MRDAVAYLIIIIILASLVLAWRIAAANRRRKLPSTHYHLVTMAERTEPTE